MVAVAFLLMAQASPGPMLTAEAGAFRIQVGEKTIRVPLVEPPKSITFGVIAREGEALVAYDKRGLTLRNGTFVKSNTLADIPVSPAAFSREEILLNQQHVKDGSRKREFSRILDRVQDGPKVILLAEWENKDGKPWLHALVSIDLAELKPRAVFAGRVPGLAQPIRDGVYCFRRRDALALISREGGLWNLAMPDRETRQFALTPIGQVLKSAVPVGFDEFLTVETTVHQSDLARRVNVVTGASQPVMESRGRMGFWTEPEPIGVIVTPRGRVLRTLDSGAEYTVSPVVEVRPTEAGVLAWTPKQRPTRAVLLDPKTWSQVAVWPAPAATPPPAGKAKPSGTGGQRSLKSAGQGAATIRAGRTGAPGRRSAPATKKGN